MERAEIFSGISHDSIGAMLECFKPEVRSFKKGETVLVYSTELEYLCVLLEGKAHLYCMDSDGEYTLLENYTANDVFGEIMAMPFGSLGYAVEADSSCRVMFIRCSCIYGRCRNACQHHTQLTCRNACQHHTQLTSNLFEISARKAQSLALRINMISKKSIRRKLEKYFEYLSSKSGSPSFEIELSLSQLAGYLCVDRSSMMRELRAMSDEGLIERRGRQVTVLSQ